MPPCRSKAVERTKRCCELVKPEIVIDPGSALSFAKSCGVPTTAIVFPAPTVNSFTTMAFATMDANVAVMVPTPDVKVVVSLDVAMQVVAPFSAPPWAFVKHRWTVQIFPAESATEERSPSLPSVMAVLSPANHRMAIFPASRFSVATVQARLVPAVLLWAVHVAPPTPKAACAGETWTRSRLRIKRTNFIPVFNLQYLFMAMGP